MTEETENLVLAMLREIRQEQRVSKDEQLLFREEQRLLREEMNARFDQMADLMTVVVSAQADLTRRVEDLESV